MKISTLFILLIIATQPINAEVQVIEWGATEETNSNSAVDQSEATVNIYVTSWCPYCKKAIDYLESNGIKYNKYDIEKDLSAATRKKKLAPNYSGIPLAVINGKILKGFSKSRYSAALKN